MPISAEIAARVQGFFTEEVLSETRIVRATIPEPVLYPLVRIFGIQGMLEMSAIGAITLVDVVAYPEDIDLDTLFHELVHVVQFRILGLREFARQYVRGFVAGGGYDGIPLERQAYALGERFERRPEQIFSVEEEVMRRFAEGRF
jgi:hypothetical protein